MTTSLIPLVCILSTGRSGSTLLDLLLHVLGAVQGQVRWLVDASRDPYRLHWLAASGRFDLRVIHLTRDPRAYVFSIVRGQLDHALRPALVAAARWGIENAIALRLRARALAPGQVLQVRYAALATQPAETMARIGSWLGLHYRPETVATFREQENHAIAGNKMRWENTPIRLDRIWRPRLPRLYAEATRAITWPLRRRLGY